MDTLILQFYFQGPKGQKGEPGIDGLDGINGTDGEQVGQPYNHNLYNHP